MRVVDIPIAQHLLLIIVSWHQRGQDCPSSNTTAFLKQVFMISDPGLRWCLTLRSLQCSGFYQPQTVALLALAIIVLLLVRVCL